jgi:hypothetical protein
VVHLEALVRLATVVLAAALAVVLAHPPSAWAERARSEAGGLTFHRADGSRIVFDGTVRAWCGALNNDDPTRTLTVAVLQRSGRGYARPFWLVQSVVPAFPRARTIRFPVGLDRSGAIVFVYDRKTGNEVSSAEEKSTGRLTLLLPIRCARGSRVRLAVSGLLASEVGKQPLRVSGTVVATLGPRPSWYPR